MINLSEIKNEFKFSIIMTSYNTEFYLKEAIDSVINQTLDFKGNTQLILVDDGTRLEPKNIALEYQEKYPDNIIILSEKLSSVESGRNLGLKYAKGEFINFLDSDDKLSQNVLLKVKNFFEKYNEDTDIVAVPINYIDQNPESYKLNYKFNEDMVIDLNEEGENIVYSISSVFIKNTSIKKEFDCDIPSSDILFLLSILLEKKSLGVLKLSSSYYHYRKRNPIDAIPDDLRFNKEFYINRLKKIHLKIINSFLENNEKIPDFIQYTLLYDLKKVMNNDELFIYDDKDEEKELWDILKYISTNIDNNIILSNNFYDDSLKYFFYKLSNDINYDFDEENILVKCEEDIVYKLDKSITIENIKIKDKILYISGSFKSLFDKDSYDLEVLNENDSQIFNANLNNDKKEGPSIIFNNEDNNEEKISYLSKTLVSQQKFNIEIPIDFVDLELKFRLKLQGKYNLLNIDIDDNILEKENDSALEEFTLDLDKQTLIIKHLFKFSIVMAIYNTEEYLHKAIDSVINQTIGFKDNVQLILVNDGSEDSSEEICLEYQKLYPKNILVFSQENAGQASARNQGLEYAKGKYVNFLDSDDYLSENALEEVYKFFRTHYNETDIVSLPLKTFGRIESEHNLNYKFKTSRVINLEKEPNNPQLHVSSSFFKYSEIDKLRFSTRLVASEDANFINHILLNKRTLGVINSASYFYRKRFDSSSTLDTMTSLKEYYTDRLKYHFLEMIYYSLNVYGDLPLFLQYTLIYDLHWLILTTDLDSFKNKNEREEFLFYINKIISFLDEKVLINNKNISSKLLESFLLYLKTNDLHFEIKDNEVFIKNKQKIVDKLSIHKLWLDIVELKDDYLNISGFLNSQFPYENISIEALKELNNGDIEKYLAKYVKYSSRKEIKFLDKNWQYKLNFDLKIPLKKYEKSNIKIKVNFHKDADNNNFDENNLLSYYLNIDFQNFTRLSHISNYKIKDSHLLAFESNSFNLMPNTLKSILVYERNNRSKIKNEKNMDYNDALNMRLLYWILYPLYKNKRIWLFMDRRESADDNSEHLFKYSLNQKDNIKKYFIISKESEDFNRLKKIGNVIKFKSLRHKINFLFAEKIICTHPEEIVTNPFIGKNYKLYSGLIENEKIFIQHGVTISNISSWLHKFDKNLSFLLSVSDLEKNSFLDEGYNYKEEIIHTLGFPRFDNLFNNINKKHEKQVLIMPSWRHEFTYFNKETFEKSLYFEIFNELINDENLMKICKEYNYKILFKPHPNVYKFIDLFDTNDYVKIDENSSYQDVFLNSDLLLTDFSSIAFDFAYMKKPVIYYQFSKDFHFNIEENYFQYPDMGFGEIKVEKDELIEKIKFYLETNCQMEEKYEERVENFFKYIDNKNCQRVYDYLKEH